MTREDHTTDADGTGTHPHHADDVESVSFGVLTVSSSRTPEHDESGDTLAEAIEGAGHAVSVRDLVTDDTNAIRDRVRVFVDDGGVDAVVTTGGTGLTADDVTPEALESLFDRTIPGFGERFRARSVEAVGPHGMLTRATAGVVDDTPVFCLPGSEQAAGFGASEFVLPVVGHVVTLARDSGHHSRRALDGNDQQCGHDHEGQQ